MQTSVTRARFSSVYEWLQVGRLERSQVQGGELFRSSTLACLYSQPWNLKLSALPSNDYNRLATITPISPELRWFSPGPKALQLVQSALNYIYQP